MQTTLYQQPNVCFKNGEFIFYPWIPVSDRNCCLCIGYCGDGYFRYMQKEHLSLECACSCHGQPEPPIFFHALNPTDYANGIISHQIAKEKQTPRKKSKKPKKKKDAIKISIEELKPVEEKYYGVEVDSDYLKDIITPVDITDHENNMDSSLEIIADNEEIDDGTIKESQNVVCKGDKKKRIMEDKVPILPEHNSGTIRIDTGKTIIGNLNEKITKFVVHKGFTNNGISVEIQKSMSYSLEYKKSPVGDAIFMLLKSERFGNIMDIIVPGFDHPDYVPRFFALDIGEFQSIKTYINKVCSLNLKKSKLVAIAKTVQIRPVQIKGRAFQTSFYAKLANPFISIVFVQWGDCKMPFPYTTLHTGKFRFITSEIDCPIHPKIIKDLKNMGREIDDVWCLENPREFFACHAHLFR
jgi:hypothetical protein